MSIENEIENLRQKLPHVHSNPPHLISITENDEISIVAADRPDKAVVIGPGGYIAGHLAKAHNKSLTITAYTDHMIQDYRKKESRQLLHELPVTKTQRKILKVLEGVLDKNYFPSKDITIGAAISGGRDSLASVVLLNDLFTIKGVTVYPSDIILPKHMRDSIDETVNKLHIDHEYIESDFSHIIKKALQGKIHPCGHCHQAMMDIVIKTCSTQGIPAVLFGELLPTGSQSLRLVDDVLIINLPAFLALTKRDTTRIASTIKEFSSFTFQCPLLKHVHKKYPSKKYATAQRLFREVRAGILEPGEAMNYLKPLLRSD
jgi:predicted PP-loop superfamily ATPase